MTGKLRDVRTQLLIVVGVLVLLDVAALALLLSPAGRSRGARQQEFERLRMEKIEKTRGMVPLENMDKVIEVAREQEAQFNNERLLAHYSTMSEQLYRIAKDSGVHVSNVKFDNKQAKGTPAGYENLDITMRVSGGYEQDIRFINALERQKLLLLISGVSFEGMQGQDLTVSVHLSTLLRSAA